MGPPAPSTGKARSYLIKQGIAFENRAAGEERFRAEIVPKIGRWIIPVLEGEDGEIVQDGSDIITHFESRETTRHPAFPATPLHALIGHIFELFGGEGLLRPAMHFRWNFDDINRDFLAEDFPAALAPTGASAEERATVFAMASRRMRKAMAIFRVSPECTMSKLLCSPGANRYGSVTRTRKPSRFPGWFRPHNRRSKCWEPRHEVHDTEPCRNAR